ncbi:MAG: hypothetical protein ACOX5R_09335 [bacterium]
MNEKGRNRYFTFLGIGLILTVAPVLLLWVIPVAAWYGLLAAFLFMLSLPLGAAAVLMCHHLTAGRWGWSIYPYLPSLLLLLPLLGGTFVLLCFGLDVIYPWAQTARVENSPVLTHRQPYLNTPFFIVRGIVYFLIWGGLVFSLIRGFRRTAEQKRDTITRLPTQSALGLVLYFLTMTFAAVDWVMSLSEHWFSTIFGAYLIIGQILMTLALLIIIKALHIRRDGSFHWDASVLTDLGNLLLAFVVLHAYMAFSQFFIIWNGNKPHEVLWYIERTRGAWKWIAIAIIIVHFALPFFALLFRRIKRNPRLLLGIAAVLLFMRLVENAWIVIPAAPERQGEAVGIMLVFTAGLGMLSVAIGLRAWSRHSHLRPLEYQEVLR